MANNSLVSLFQKWATDKKPPIIQLLNKNKEAVGAIYLETLKADIGDLVICTTGTDEKYYLYVKGIAIFFSYYKIQER